MSFESSEGTQVALSEPPAYVQPFAEQLLQRAGSLSSSQWPTIPGAERVAPLSGAQSLGVNMGTTRGALGSPVTGAAGQSLMSLMGPDAAFNPITNQLVSQAQSNIVDQFNTQVAPSTAARFNRPGGFGSTPHQEYDAINRYSLARALGETETGIRNDALNRSLQASAQAPGIANQDWLDINALMQLGGIERGVSQSMLDADLARFMDIRNDPTRRLDILGAAINTAGGGYSKTTQQVPQPNPFLSALGATGSFAGGIGSLLSALG